MIIFIITHTYAYSSSSTCINMANCHKILSENKQSANGTCSVKQYINFKKMHINATYCLKIHTLHVAEM